jgi:solute carrier family 35 protein E3
VACCAAWKIVPALTLCVHTSSLHSALLVYLPCCACVRSVGLRVFAKFGVFELKGVEWKRVLPLAAAYALCTPLSNLSLAFNSVGFYQMLKILTTPYVALIEGLFYGASFSGPIKLSLAIVTIGVLLASVNDVEVRHLSPALAAQ